MSDQTINDAIITYVQQYPHLYDKKDPSYKDLLKRENSWKTISKYTNMSVEDCQTRWKSLRDRYTREKKKLDAPSGSGAVHISECSKQLIRSLSFLDKVVQHRKTGGNYSLQFPIKSGVENIESQGTSSSESPTIPQPSTAGRSAIASCSKKVILPITNLRFLQSGTPNQNLASFSTSKTYTTLQSSTAGPSAIASCSKKVVTPITNLRLLQSGTMNQSSASSFTSKTYTTPQSSTAGTSAIASCSKKVILPITNLKLLQNGTLNRNPASSTSPINVTPPLTSPAADSSPSPTEMLAASMPRGRFRTISSSDRESSSSQSYSDPHEIEGVDMTDNGGETKIHRAESNYSKSKRVRNEDVNTAIVNALASLSKKTKKEHVEASRADQLFAESVVADLQRFPPRKKTLLKGEIMQLISKYDETELP